MTIDFFSEDCNLPEISSQQVTSWLDQVAQMENKVVDSLNIIFCSDDYLLDINREHLNHNYYTDIITFPTEMSDTGITGDLFISIDRVRDNASHMSQSFERELNRVMVHGTLHLLGYEDKTEDEQRVMRQKEDFYLAIL